MLASPNYKRTSNKPEYEFILKRFSLQVMYEQLRIISNIEEFNE
ncbi:hypothetical protein [Vibrio gallaecicus]|nr:hypothetical protein [Vibrio gallaecicus]MDN3613525.1 hypothetical protein [Vibrio gallaecicus]